MTTIAIDTAGRIFRDLGARRPISLAEAMSDIIGPCATDLRVYLIEERAKGVRCRSTAPPVVLSPPDALSLRVSAPRASLDRLALRVRYGHDSTPTMELGRITRRTLEEALNSVREICDAGGVDVVGCLCSEGCRYRVIWRRPGARMPLRLRFPGLEWETSPCCRVETIHRGSRTCQAIADLCIRPYPSMAFPLHPVHHVGPLASVTTTPPLFDGDGVQIDHLQFEPGTTGYFALRVAGGTPTPAFPTTATATGVLAALAAVAPGEFSSFTGSPGGLDLHHALPGVRPTLEIDASRLRAEPSVEGTMALSPLLRDLAVTCGTTHELAVELVACNGDRTDTLLKGCLSIDLEKIDMSQCSCCDSDHVRRCVRIPIPAGATSVDVPYHPGANFSHLISAEIHGPPTGVAKSSVQDIGVAVQVGLTQGPVSDGTHFVEICFEIPFVDLVESTAPTMALVPASGQPADERCRIEPRSFSWDSTSDTDTLIISPTDAVALHAIQLVRSDIATPSTGVPKVLIAELDYDGKATYPIYQEQDYYSELFGDVGVKDGTFTLSTLAGTTGELILEFRVCETSGTTVTDADVDAAIDATGWTP